MRLILYTGKGGVGKSSIAAASAVRAAESGCRTLLVSSDLAHNLADIFGRPVGGEPTLAAPDLTLLEIDVLREIRENWTPIHNYFADFLVYLGMEGAVAEEVALFPGTDDFFLLTRILREFESRRYDLIIVDCSPTAGILRLLTLSDSACTRLNKLMDVERKVMKLVRPFARKIKAVKEMIPEDEFYGVLDELVRKVGRLGEILKQPEVSSIRLVLNPDRIAIAETRRAFTYFGLFGFPVDGIFVNKVLPVELEQGYLRDWFALQQQLLVSIDQSFLDIAQFRVPLLDHEPIGLEPLSELAKGIFKDRRPEEVLSSSKPVTITLQDGKPRLTFRLPQVAKQEIDVGRKEADLIVKAGGYTRVFALPDSLMDREVVEARFAEGQLTITFS